MSNKPRAHTAPTAVISTREMREAMLRSGYLLESRLETTLIDRGWEAEANRAYVDPVTLKSREYDLFARKVFPVQSARLEVAVLCMVVECINNPQPVAFITKGRAPHPRLETTLRLLSTEPGWTDSETGAWHPPEKPFAFSEDHHYARGPLATQYCSFTRKKASGAMDGQWLAQHENEQHENFLKLSAALDYETGKVRARKPRADGSPSVHIYYPVLVLQGKLVEAWPSRRSVQIRAAGHTQFLRVTAEGGRQTTYQIDVVTERAFLKYLDMIEGEVQDAVSRTREE